MAPNLYRVKLGGPIERLTQGPGSYQVNLSPDGRQLPGDLVGHPARRPRSSSSPPTASSSGPWTPIPCTGSRTIGSAHASGSRSPPSDGFLLEGELILPPDLDTGKKYPVWFMTYGGPHTPMTGDGWMGGRLWDQALAERGLHRLPPRPAEPPAARGPSRPGRPTSSSACASSRTSRRGSPGSSRSPTWTAPGSA